MMQSHTRKYERADHIEGLITRQKREHAAEKRKLLKVLLPVVIVAALLALGYYFGWTRK